MARRHVYLGVQLQSGTRENDDVLEESLVATALIHLGKRLPEFWEDKDMHCDRQSGINEQQGKALLARAKRGGRVTVTTG